MEDGIPLNHFVCRTKIPRMPPEGANTVKAMKYSHKSKKNFDGTLDIVSKLNQTKTKKYVLMAQLSVVGLSR